MKGIKGIQGRVKLPCVQCMHLLVPRSVVALLCRGSYLSLRWQHPLLVLWGPALLCKDVRMSYSSLVLFSVWCLSIVIDGCTSSDWSPGPMLVKVCYVSCLGFILVFHVDWCHAGLLCCVCMCHIHHVHVSHTSCACVAYIMCVCCTMYASCWCHLWYF